MAGASNAIRGLRWKQLTPRAPEMRSTAAFDCLKGGSFEAVRYANVRSRHEAGTAPAGAAQQIDALMSKSTAVIRIGYYGYGKC